MNTIDKYTSQRLVAGDIVASANGKRTAEVTLRLQSGNWTKGGWNVTITNANGDTQNTFLTHAQLKQRFPLKVVSE